MSEHEDWLTDILPPSATILGLRNANDRPAILLADLDGDRMKELIVAYRYQKENYLLLLKNFKNEWYPILEVKGKGFAITDLMAVPLTNRGVNTLIVGWQMDHMQSHLFLLQWHIYGFVNLIPCYMEYSKLFAEDIYGKYAKDGQYELAIWNHVKDKAYNVDVFRYNGAELTKANSHYPTYFRKVISYYKQLLLESENDLSIYWYYLAEAHLMAGEINQALMSVNKAISLSNPFPSREKMLNLKDEIMDRQRKM